jgi:hypothetical protein
VPHVIVNTELRQNPRRFVLDNRKYTSRRWRIARFDTAPEIACITGTCSGKQGPFPICGTTKVKTRYKV